MTQTNRCPSLSQVVVAAINGWIEILDEYETTNELACWQSFPKGVRVSFACNYCIEPFLMCVNRQNEQPNKERCGTRFDSESFKAVDTKDKLPVSLLNYGCVLAFVH